MTALNIPTLTLGDRLRRARLDAGIRSEEMADLFAVGRTTITNWETGKAKPSPRKISRWAELVAERSDYKAKDLLVFFGVEQATASVISVHERRRNERRHKGKQTPGCTTDEIDLIAA